MGNQDILIMHKVSCVDLFKDFIAGARGGRPGLIIMHKVSHAYSDLLKTSSPESAEASRDLLMHKVFRGYLCIKFFGGGQKDPQNGPRKWPKREAPEVSKPFDSLVFWLWKGSQKGTQNGTQNEPQKGTYPDLCKNFIAGAAEARDLLLMHKVFSLIPT